MTERIAVDTSAIVAVVFGEEDAGLYADALASHAGGLMLSEVTRFELGVVVESKQGAPGVLRLSALFDDLDVEWATVDASITGGALAAWREFGKGRHPARLNLGDCFSYALAMQLDAPLLYKGDDFALTDVRSALE
ncbi:type II toxin-antitoxin system VapC family toxin [Microbacterium elymi]|uniref:Ribonuclease VapC n=1 Tax=Microbacterium elymi TaxID=2909587 RepID=A0ABY5NJS4_9MICO|nr:MULTISPECIES: type II toxin-antitoxin system VapC family toxin [Microbacterium]UUT35420.1 type II toxin-antitoxin system VapC family toxin [Microbacterium elymi]